jgi:hypothetical protein
MTLQIVCDDSSDPSTFQCMSGRLIWEWPATAVSYLDVSPWHLEIVSPSGCSSAWGGGRSRRGPNPVSKVGWEPRECCACPRIPWHSGPRGMAHCHGAEARYRKTICEAVSDDLNLKGVAEQLCRQSDLWSGNGEETRDAPDPPRQRKWTTLSWHLIGLVSLFWPTWRQHLPLWRHLPCLRVIAINPWFISCNNAWQEGGVIFGTLQQFAARCRKVFCLISCEKPGNKFCWHASHSKILHQYRLAYGKWQIEFISNLSDCQTSVPMDYRIGMVNSLVGSHRWMPACVWIVVGRAAFLKSAIPLKCLGPTQRCLSESLL